MNPREYRCQGFTFNRDTKEYDPCGKPIPLPIVENAHKRKAEPRYCSPACHNAAAWVRRKERQQRDKIHESPREADEKT